MSQASRSALVDSGRWRQIEDSLEQLHHDESKGRTLGVRTIERQAFEGSAGDARGRVRRQIEARSGSNFVTERYGRDSA